MTLSPDRVLPSHVSIEACENYQKQSYRNRCYILAGDGVQMLQVPVLHQAPSRCIRSICVDKLYFNEDGTIREVVQTFAK